MVDFLVLPNSCCPPSLARTSAALTALIVHPSLLACDGARGLLEAGIVREAEEWEQQPPTDQHAAQVKYDECPAECSGARDRECITRFCECPANRAGAYCQSHQSTGPLLGKDDSVLTMQVAPDDDDDDDDDDRAAFATHSTEMAQGRELAFCFLS